MQITGEVSNAKRFHCVHPFFQVLDGFSSGKQCPNIYLLA
jgi:hypothetical protein